jgi:hypothetical protein
MRIVTEFGVRGGVLRGIAPVPVRDLAAGQGEEDRYKVGLNYGGPHARFRSTTSLTPTARSWSASPSLGSGQAARRC